MYINKKNLFYLIIMLLIVVNLIACIEVSEEATDELTGVEKVSQPAKFEMFNSTEEIRNYLDPDKKGLTGDIFVTETVRIVMKEKNMSLTGTFTLNGYMFKINSEGIKKKYEAEGLRDLYVGELEGEISSRDVNYPITIKYSHLDKEEVYFISINNNDTLISIGEFNVKSSEIEKYKLVN